MALPQALVMFVDIRGFTKWAEKAEVAPHLAEFLQEFSRELRAHFAAPASPRFALVKPLGDGAMIVRQLLQADDVDEALREALMHIDQVEGAFRTLCRRFWKAHGVRTSLRVGWGIVRGDVTPLDAENTDFAGPNLNKASRLCGIAKPGGVAIDADDFDEPGVPFVRQRRTLEGLGRLDVWVTEEIAETFLRREVLHECPEVHVAGVCLDLSAEPRILVAKRARDRELFGGLYEGCGGQLAYGETFADGLLRHFRGDFGIEVKVHEEFHIFYRITYAGGTIPGIRFLCELSGTKKPRKRANHESVDFITIPEFANRPEDEFIDGLKVQALSLYERFIGGRAD